MMIAKMRSNQCAANPAIAPWLQSTRPEGRVAEFAT